MSEKNSAPPLPSVESWRPRDASETLSAAFEKECNNAERRILQGLEDEKKFGLDSFESGLPFEGIVRRELKRAIPPKVFGRNRVLVR